MISIEKLSMSNIREKERRRYIYNARARTRLNKRIASVDLRSSRQIAAAVRESIVVGCRYIACGQSISHVRLVNYSSGINGQTKKEENRRQCALFRRGMLLLRVCV